MTRNRHSLRPDDLDPDRAKIFASKLIILGPLVAVAGGRWGSYLGVSGTPVFFADLAVGLGSVLLAVHMLSAPSSRGSVYPPGTRRRLTVGFVCVVGILCIGLSHRIGLSGGGIATIRDAIPFVYLLLIPVFVSAVRTLGSELAIRWLRNATIVHSLWFVPAMLGVLGEVTVPVIAGAPLFSTRGDFDVLICGLAVVLLLVGPKIDPRAAAILICANVAGALLSGSRAGLIAAIIIAIVVGVTKRPFKDRERGPVRFALVCIAIGPLVVLAAIVANSPPSWARGLQKLLPNDSATYQTGQNTASARSNAWTLVIDYVTGEDGSLFGLGFGSNPILDSGAVRYLSGDVAVRSAHNFAVTWFGFIGAAGLLLLVIAMLAWFSIALTNVRERQLHAFVGAGLMGGLIVAGLVGVIMESPFGYTTFALAAGLAAAGGPAALALAPTLQLTESEPRESRKRYSV